MTDLSIDSIRQVFFDRLQIFVRAFERGLAQDRSSIDGALRLLTRPTQFPQNPTEPGLWKYGLQYRPVALGLLFTSGALAAAMTLAACQELRAFRRQNPEADLEPMDWMGLTSALLQNGTQLRSGHSLFGGAFGIGFGAIVLGLGQYYLMLTEPGIRNAFRAVTVDIFVSVILMLPLTALLMPFVGAPVAYCYICYRALVAFRA
ncbi:hypothetical protein C475_19763 [Halosimplex carlsbadense 2-9-1]|uniref:Yip1 domain-containing protein n=1 Tax=Halosimplex carlsbadense 2-9-1 TaxID=797114 RepID=M0CCA0_9EURY|nr:hypothetical protein [Halosimplex carlsbadense]ELZ20870.1 hypothetical protein C475_19763 [Halosimplex carlsbadense 2-9-1]